MPDNYHQRRKAEHRAWLQSFKQRCARCDERRAHKLTILDPATGRGVGVSEGGWSMPTKRREEIAATAIVLCHSCGYRYRQDRATG